MQAPGSLTCSLHMFSPIFLENRSCGLAGTNGGFFRPVAEDFENCLFKPFIEFVRTSSAASKRTVADLMPAMLPFFTPFDRSSAGLAYFIRNHRDLRFWGSG